MRPVAADAPRIIASCDPGLKNPAAAVAVDGRIVAASRICVKHVSAELDPGERADRVAEAIGGWIVGRIAGGAPDLFVMERAQVYDRVGGKSKVNPNIALIPLVMVASSTSGQLRRHARALGRSIETRAPQPAEWLGGNLPKTTEGDPLDSPRGQRVWRELDDGERASVVLSHDAIDAVGLVLWALGRFRRRRAYARA